MPLFRPLRIRLPRAPGAFTAFAGALPEDLAGWHAVLLHVRSDEAGSPESGAQPGVRPGGWVATLALATVADPQPEPLNLVRPLDQAWSGTKLGIVFLGPGTSGCTVRLHGVPDVPDEIGLTLVPLPHALAVAAVWLQNPRLFQSAFRAAEGSFRTRFRRAVSVGATLGQAQPRAYADWARLFDTWPAEQLDAMQRALPRRPGITALVFHAAPAAAPPARTTPAPLAATNSAPLAATLASLAAQTYPAARTVVLDAATPVPALDAEGWVALLQAGEVLPRHALLLFATAIGDHPDAQILLADEDRLRADGVRADPAFRPAPHLTLMCSGLLSQGVWLVRSALLAPVDGPGPVLAPEQARWAECVRLAAWFRLHAAGQAGAAMRVPRVLSHRRTDAEAAPATALAAVIDPALRAAGIAARVTGEAVPLRLQWHGGEITRAKVSILVPSRLKGQVQTACLQDVIGRTAHANLEMLIVVTQDAPLDAEQTETARRLCADPRVRVEHLRRPGFNYSVANNVAAGLTDGPFLCLLNDDVSTLEPDWLDRMVAVLSDPHAGIVGAKLYYPDMTAQHAGVIMGLDGLAQHANRFIPRGEPGYQWRAVLDQELSCVTGACLLVRRSLFEHLGGLDEALPSGFNDVDFCLRARAAGHGVVFAASVELVHHETISFGHHYDHDMSREMADVRLMQGRWAAVCRADPFHNPNLSLVGASEWEPAFPPRPAVVQGA